MVMGWGIGLSEGRSVGGFSVDVGGNVLLWRCYFIEQHTSGSCNTIVSSSISDATTPENCPAPCLVEIKAQYQYQYPYFTDPSCYNP